MNVFENEFDAPGISTLICNDLESKTALISYLLCEYGILKGRETLFYTFERRCDYYYRHLLSCISKIDKNLLIKYLYPWLGISHDNTDMINRFYFVSAIEKIQQSNLFMMGETQEEDYLDHILKMLEFDTSTLIVIEDFDLLVEKTKYSRKETLRKIKECSSKYEVHFILINYKKYEYCNHQFEVSIKDVVKKFKTLYIENSQKRITLKYNKNNYEIEKKEKMEFGK